MLTREQYVLMGPAALMKHCEENAAYAERIHASASALVAKLDECRMPIANAFQMAYTLRGSTYAGPEYGTALEDLRATLARKDVLCIGSSESKGGATSGEPRAPASKQGEAEGSGSARCSERPIGECAQERDQ
jgi:hypothetical protein